MTKLIIVVKICYKLLYVIQVVKRFLISSFLASTDIKVFGRTYLFAMLLLIGLTLFIPRVFLFSISLLFWKYKHMLLLASSREVLHGRITCTCLAHNIALKLNFEKLRPEISLQRIHQYRLCI